jgi:environmental stress-induced protein Ves
MMPIMTTPHFFDLATIPGTPWKNGGGSTQELACWPPGAGMDTFEWRVSLATVDRPGPFSVFPGIDRQIMLLGGDGLHLRSPGWEHRLDQRWAPWAFAGDDEVEGVMLGGTSKDFNLMLRRGAWRGALQVLREAPPPAAAGLCMVLQGTWQATREAAWQEPRSLTPGQGFWWVGGQGARVEPVPDDGATAPVLAWVALEKVPAAEVRRP